MSLDPISPPLVPIEPAEGGLDLRQMGKVLVKKAWLIVLLGLLGAFYGLYFLKHLPQVYSALAVLEVDPVEQKIVSFQEAAREDGGAQDMLDSYVATMKSRPFLTQVVESNALASNPEFTGGGPVAEGQAVDLLAGCEEILVRPTTRFIEVGIHHGNPRMAQMLANAICNELIKQGMQQRAATSQLAVDFLKKQAETLKDNLTDSEMKQEAYIEQNGSLSVNPTQDTSLSDMKNEENNLNGARAEVLRLETDDQEATRFADQPEKLLNIPEVAGNPLILANKEKVADLQGKIVTMRLRYGSQHPKMIQAKDELAQAEAALTASLIRIPALIHSTYESALAKERKFEAAEQQSEKQIMTVNQKSIGYSVLHGTVEINRALYEAVLKRLGETQVAQGIEVTPLHIFEAAMLPAAPVTSSKIKILLTNIARGLATGVAIAFGLNALDSSLRSVEQAEKVTGLPVAGAIPVASRSLARTGWVLRRDPGSSASEAFRSLRTFLFSKGRQKRPKTVLFTSAVPGEGKTFCSINCAVSLAQQGLRTIIIDADMRAPAVSRILLPKDSSEGLSGVLEGRIDLKEAIQPLEIESLFLLSGGPISESPADLLARPDFGHLVEELEGQFDCVIIDSAPILPVCDTLLLVHHAESVCLVARANRTPRKAVLRASKLLTEAGASISGVLLNMLAPASDPEYYMYKKSYGDRIRNGKHVNGRLGLPAPKWEASPPRRNGVGRH